MNKYPWLRVLLALAFALTALSGPVYAQDPEPSSTTITITESGLDPSNPMVTAGTKVIWQNETDQPQSLSFEVDTIFRVYLPLVIRGLDQTTRRATIQNAGSAGSPVVGSFDTQIPAGGSFTYSYNDLGRFDFVVGGLDLSGDVLVVPQNTREIRFDPVNGTLTLDVTDVPLVEILEVLRYGFDLKVVVPELQNQPITVAFQDLPVDFGLQQIVRPQGSRFHYSAIGAEFETNVSLDGDRGTPTGTPGGQYQKGNQPEPPRQVVKPTPAPYDPDVDEGNLKLPPEESFDIPEQPKEPREQFYELDHLNYNFSIDSSGDIVPVAGTTTDSGLNHSNRLVGNFLYRVTVDGEPDLVGSMSDPLEVAVHGGRGHAHFGLIAEENLFNLALPNRYVGDSQMLDATEIAFYRLPEPMPVNATEPLPQELTVENFGTFQPYLIPVDTVTGSELQNALSISPTVQSLTSHADATTLLRSGSPGDKKNLVIIGEGFQADEQDTFNNFAETYVIDGIFEHGVLRETMNAFNIYRVNIDSNDSGVTQIDEDDNVTTDRDTALDYEYSGDWDQCWMEPGPNTNSLLNKALKHAVPEWDYVFIVLNESSGGGCRRGSTAAVTISNPNGWTTGNHELGHMVGDLGDEYFGSGAYSGGEPSAVNLTKQTERSSIKWNEWIHPDTPIPTECGDVDDRTGDVGLFEGATIGTTKYGEDIYRPSCTGRMRSNTPDHNPVGYTQMRETVRDFHDYAFDDRDTYAGDFNGDGRDDVVLHYGNTLVLYVSTGYALELDWIQTGELPGWDDFRQGDRFFVGDFNADGMDDLYVFNVSDWVIPYFAMLRSTGSGFELVERYDEELPGWDDMKWRDEFFVGDYDGDGRDDIAVFNYGDWDVGYFQLLRSTGTELSYVKRYDEELPGWDDMKWRDQFFIGDFNADGKDDVFVFNYGDWDVGYLEMLESTGSDLAYVKRYDEELPGWDDMRQNDTFYVADFNGDGRDDLYVFNGRDWSEGYLQMLRSTGTSLSNTRRYDKDVPGWDDLMPNDRFFVANVDGDEDDDLYAFNAYDWDSEYLGILQSFGTTLSGSWQKDWINSWNLHGYDDFAVGNFNGGGGWDDLFVFNDHYSTTNDWFGLLRSRRSSLGLNAIYRNWITNHNYHKFGWW